MSNVKTKKINKNNDIINNKLYKKGEKLYKLKKYEEAYLAFLDVLNISKDKKVYKRLIECLTKDYTYKENNKNFNKLLNEYITSYKILATKRELTFFSKKLDNYKNVKPIKTKSNFILIFLLGFLGVHKFIEKKYISGIIYLFTFGLFGVGVLVDLVNDYAEYEDTYQLDIVRYIISCLFIIFAIINYNNMNFYYLILAGILFSPIVFSKLLERVPKIIKIIGLIILVILGLKTTPIVDSVPLDLIGTWKTSNETTNFVSVRINSDKSTIKFNDRDKEIGINEYDSETKILKVYINATTYYKFKMNSTKKELCIYNDSNSCNVSFIRSK